LIPGTATTIGLFDPAGNSGVGSVSTGPAATGYNSGVLLADGNVLLIPNTATTIKIYNPVTNTLTTGPSATTFSGGVLIPDGRVIMCPIAGPGAANVGLYLSNTPAPAEFCLHPCFNKL
jgi:hypothetical protein